MDDFAELDNPVWHALTSAHAPLARAAGSARRYPGDVSPLSALGDPGPQAFADLRALVATGESVGLFTTGPLDVPDDWELVRTRTIDQMVCARVVWGATRPLAALGSDDVPQMLALTAATEPGPFLPGTIRMGHYVGVRDDAGRLIAMAGQRLRLSRFTEISAVCTDPAHRGRGHARELVATLAARELADGRIPFLHVKTENEAKAVYAKVGFVIRRAIHVTVVTPRSADAGASKGD